MKFSLALLAASLFLTNSVATADESWPPGWLPIKQLSESPSWSEVREIDDRVQLYLPNGKESVRGVFICFVFHSSDPRELARHWNFALVTVPWPFIYDLGHNDKRSGRYKLGHDSQDMRLLLRYLEKAAKDTQHPELTTVPIVGWLGQNGSHLCADLYQHSPHRILAWSDSFPGRLRQYPELTKAVPFPFAWEISKKELRNRERVYKQNEAPLPDLSARANTYGFGHGIYSKYNYFMAYIDRCIQLRMPKVMPPPGKPVILKDVNRSEGWIGDFDPIGEWNPILPANAKEASGAKYSVWLPDEYAAWMWRSYHSANPPLKLTGPVIEYRKKDGKWGGPACGLGYNGYLKANTRYTFSVQVKGEFEKVIYHDGNVVLGEVAAPPWTLEGVQLKSGLRVLFAVGVKADGSKSASRPAFAIVQE